MALVTMPDGTVVQMPDKLDAATAQRLRAFQGKAAAKPAKPAAGTPALSATTEESPTSLKNLVGAATEPMLSMLTGAVATPIAGLTGLVAPIFGDNPADVIRANQSRLTYQPRTTGGKNAMKAFGAIPEAIDEWQDRVARKYMETPDALGRKGSPAGATALTLPVKALAQLLGAKGAKIGASALDRSVPSVGNIIRRAAGAPEKPTGAARVAENQPMIDKARSLGYVLKPSEAGGKIGTVAEGMTGSPKMSVEASAKNQTVTNRVGAEEIGLTRGTRLTKESLTRAKAPHNAVYREMQQLGEVSTDPQYKGDINGIGRTPGTSFAKDVNPEIERLRDAYASEARFHSADAVLKIRQLRANATKNIKAREAPERNELGYAQQQVANALEAQMERHATTLGKADLVQRFRTARKELAKIHSVENAMIGNTGDLSAQELARQLEHGVPLSGRLKDIADIATEFGEVTRDRPALRNKVPVTVLEGLSGLLGAGLTYGAHPALGGGALAGMLARPAVRRALLSRAYQDRLTSAGRGKSTNRAPATAAALPIGAAQSSQPSPDLDDQALKKALAALGVTP